MTADLDNPRLTDVIAIPSRTWYDPVLDATLHTGADALDAVARFVSHSQRTIPIAFDIETPGLDNAFTINCVTAAWDWPDGSGTHAVLLDPRRRSNDHAAAEDIAAHAATIAFHNAPFDIPPLFHAGLFGKGTINRVVDTLLLARLSIPDVMVPKNLTALSIRLLGMRDDKGGMERAFKAAGYKTIAAGYEGMDVDSPVYRFGAMADTVATLRLEPVLRQRAIEWLLDHPFSTYGATTVGEAQEKIATQETVHRVMLRRSAVGLAVNRAYLDTYAEQVDTERNLAEAELAVHGLEGGTGKGGKLVEYLDAKGELPQPWPRSPKTRKLRATKADIEALATVNTLAAAQVKLAEIEKVMGYLEKVDRQASVTGRCHPQVQVLGASATGRMSYNEPPLQQFSAPARGIITDDGQGLTSIDWSQIEPVTMALMARDHDFLAPFEAGADLYEPIMRACGCDRPTAKIVLLATMYGQGTAALAARIGHTEESAAQIKRQMFLAMKKCERWMAKVQEIAMVHGRVPTAAGRILPVDEGGVFKAVNYCLSPHTLVLRSDLIHVRADSVQVGDRVVAFDEHPQHEGGNHRKYHQMRTATVEAVSSVVKPTVVVATDDGMQTGCSADHLWLVRPHSRRFGYGHPLLRWVRADELEPGDELLSLGRWQTDNSRTAGYVAGLLDGEGCLTRNIEGQRKSCQIGFSQLAGPVMDTYLKAMAELGIPAKHRPRGETSTSPTDSATTSGVRTVMRLVGTVRPERFLARAESIYEGRSITAGLTAPVKVRNVKHIGDTELTSIQTSTRTLVANGYLSHNCVQGSAYDVLAHTIETMERQGIGDHVQLALHDELVVDTPVAAEVQQIMLTPPDFLITWAERIPVLRTDRADMNDAWAKV